MLAQTLHFLVVLIVCFPLVSMQASENNLDQSDQHILHNTRDERLSVLAEGFDLLHVNLQHFMVEKNAGHWPFEMITAPSGEQQSRLELIINEAEIFMIAGIQKRLENGLSCAFKGDIDGAHLAILNYATDHQEFFGKKLSKNSENLKSLIAATAAELEMERIYIDDINHDEK